MTVVTREDLERQQVRDRARCAAQPARRVGQPAGHARQPHRRAHPRRGEPPHPGGDRRRRGRTRPPTASSISPTLVPPTSSASRCCAGRRAASTAPAPSAASSASPPSRARSVGAQPQEPRLARSAPGDFDGAARRAATTRRGARSSSHWRNTDGFNISPAGSEDDGARISSFALPRRVALVEELQGRGHVREHNKLADRDGFGGACARWCTAFDDRLERRTIASCWVGSLQATLGHASTRQLDPQVPRQGATRPSRGSRRRFRCFENDQRSRQSSATNRHLPARQRRPSGPHTSHGLIERRAEQPFEQPTFGRTNARCEREQRSGRRDGAASTSRSLFLTAGVRHDDNDDRQDFTTWQLAASLTLPGSVLPPARQRRHGVKYPSFGDLFGIFLDFLPQSQSRRPRRSFGWDFGVETTLLGGRAVVDVTYFHADLTNEIDSASSSPLRQFACTPFNRPGREHAGAASRSPGAMLVTPALYAGRCLHLSRCARGRRTCEEVRRPRHAGRIDVELRLPARPRQCQPGRHLQRHDAGPCVSAVAPFDQAARTARRAIGSSTRPPPTSCSRAWSCSGAWRTCSTSTTRRCSATTRRRHRRLRRRQAHLRRPGGHRRQLGQVASSR